nr:MAG TPA: hypothetical protein [Caudoviricetes sp.]
MSPCILPLPSGPSVANFRIFKYNSKCQCKVA